MTKATYLNYLKPLDFAASVGRIFILLALTAGPGLCYDVTDNFSLGLLSSGAVQCQQVNRASGADDVCRAGGTVLPSASFRPTDSDEFYVLLGFAAGNVLNEVSPFTAAPWAADLDANVRNINTSGRDHLLLAWYNHSFRLAPETALGFKVGLVDSTEFLNDNAYAQDVYTQFMNEALANPPQFVLPASDIGAALKLDTGRLSLRAIAMRITGSDESEGRPFLFYGAQAGYTFKTALGEGTYRLFVVGASEDFPNASGTGFERRWAGALSFDQQLGDTFGAFLRIGWQDDTASIVFKNLYSGGFNILGKAWARPEDNIGIGFAYIEGADQDVASSHIAELYYRFVVNEVFAVSADVQFMKDDLKTKSDPMGWILGLRATLEF